MSKKSGNEIQNARQDLEAAEHRYLRSHGWRYTSSTPGCLWMWVKRCELGVVNDEPTKTAISMQLHSCAIRGNKW